MKNIHYYAGLFGIIFTLLTTSACMPIQTAAAAFIESCPAQAVADMEAQFGVGTSTKTVCLQNLKEIKIVVGWNSTALNNRSGAGQQVHSTDQMVKNYTQMYNLELTRFRGMLVVAFGPGGRWMLNDEAYNRTYGVTTGNPSRAKIDNILANGVALFLCQNTMRGNGWVSTDLIPGVYMVPAGVVSIVDFQSVGFNYVSP